MHPAAKAKFIAELAEAHGRAAKLIDCGQCGAPVIRGDDDDRCSYKATVDTEPVDRIGEMLAVLNGQQTYDLVTHDGKHDLWHRNTWRVHSDQPRSHRYPIHVEHRCKGRHERTTANDALPGM